MKQCASPKSTRPASDERNKKRPDGPRPAPSRASSPSHRELDPTHPLDPRVGVPERGGRVSRSLGAGMESWCQLLKTCFSLDSEKKNKKARTRRLSPSLSFYWGKEGGSSGGGDRERGGAEEFSEGDDVGARNPNPAVVRGGDRSASLLFLNVSSPTRSNLRSQTLPFRLALELSDSGNAGFRGPFGRGFPVFWCV